MLRDKKKQDKINLVAESQLIRDQRNRLPQASSRRLKQSSIVYDEKQRWI